MSSVLIIIALSGLLVTSCSNDGVRQLAEIDFQSQDVGAPILDIGANDELGLPAAATRLSDGTIAVSDPFASAVLFFDSTGHLIRRSGRKGFGPGEFQAPLWIKNCGQDSLFVWDALRSRVSVMERTGDFVREFMHEDPVGLISCSAADQSMIVLSPKDDATFRSARPGEKRRRGFAELIIADRSGRATKSLGTVPYEERAPLAKLSQIAAGGGYIWFGSADSAYLDLYNSSGKKLRSVSLAIPLRHATQLHMDRQVERIVLNFGDERTRALNREYWKRFDPPDYLPAYARFAADAKGNVWVVLTSVGDYPTEIRGITPQGEIIADLSVKVSFTLFEVGDDYMLGSYHLDGQPRVAMYRIPRDSLTSRRQRPPVTPDH